jgi:hypothetical protein
VFVGARDSSSPVLNVVFAGGGATRALHGAAPEEEGDGAAAASFDDEGDARWTAAEELRLSKGDECDAWFSSRRRPSVGARAAASLAEEVAQDGGCAWWLQAKAENGRGREWGPDSACGRGRRRAWRPAKTSCRWRRVVSGGHRGVGGPDGEKQGRRNR